VRETHPSAPAPMDAYDANTTLQRELGTTVKSLRDELLHFHYVMEANEAPAADLELDHVGQESDLIGHELDRARVESDRVRHEFDRVRLDHDVATRELDRVRHEFDHLERQLAKVYSSRSWRLTRPVRSARRMLRRWLPGERSSGDPDTSAS